MTDLPSLREIIQDGTWLLEQDEKLVKRDLLKPITERAGYQIIEIIAGVRRAGKSKLMLDLARNLKKEGKSVYYINFDDERLIPDVSDLRKLSTLMELKGATLFLDEVQNVPQWEKWAKRLYETGVKVYITGSNASVSRNISMALAGRKKTHEIFPFSFNEYLSAKRLDKLSAEQSVKVIDDYIRNGGFPYPTISGDFSVLGEYRNDITERDIISRRSIRDVNTFKNLMRFIMANPGIYLSSKTVRNVLEISHVTLRKYLAYIDEAYCIIALEKFSFSQKERMLNPKKVYPMDNGLLIKRADLGKMFECTIAQHLRRIFGQIYYWKDERGKEVDFYIPEHNIAIQAVYELTEENREREEKPLDSIAKALKAKPLIIYQHASVDSRHPCMPAHEFLVKSDAALSTSAQKSKS
jgi:predicted AAA+ superfamily ATPase